MHFTIFYILIHEEGIEKINQKRKIKKNNDTDVRRVGVDVCGTTDRVAVGLIGL